MEFRHQPFRLLLKTSVRVGLALGLLAAAGCAESMWIVPFPAGERPSRLWSADARTQRWNAVQVEYSILGRGEIDAEVRSADHCHHFTVRGEYWYETENGERSDAYAQRDFLVVKFDGKQERYRFEHRPGIDRGILTVASP